MALTPTDPTKAQLWINGTAPNQTIDFYIPRGAKGEPGGISLGTSLGTNDLNSIVTSGVYRQTNSSGVDSPLIKNYPYAGGYGVLTVYETTAAGDVIQEFRGQSYAGSLDSRGFYRRNKSNGTWSPWRFHTTMRVDQTAGRAIYQWDDLNAREQLIYGDTGWRNISSNVLNGDATSTIHIRRTLNMVHVKTNTNPNNAGGDFFNWPVGFAPDGSTYQPVRYSGAVELVNVYVDTSKVALSQYVSGKGGVFFTGSYFCSAPWPTTLPGTAVGSIPNT